MRIDSKRGGGITPQPGGQRGADGVSRESTDARSPHRPTVEGGRPDSGIGTRASHRAQGVSHRLPTLAELAFVQAVRHRPPTSYVGRIL